jgi:hypothetical protein
MYHARRLAIRRAAAGLNGVSIPLLSVTEVQRLMPQNALFNNNIAAKRSIFSWFKGPTDHVDATPTLNGTQDHGGPMRETRALLPTPQPAKLFNELLRQDPRGRVRVMAPWFFEEDLFTLAYHFHTLHPDLPVSLVQTRGGMLTTARAREDRNSLHTHVDGHLSAVMRECETGSSHWSCAGRKRAHRDRLRLLSLGSAR